jgi:serine/threonine protein phosphatase 1
MPYTTYAIGDVHGRADLLETMLDAVAEHAEARGTEPRVLLVGDIVDRGPSSRIAMDLVCQSLERWPRSRLILGNHDAWFLDFMTAETVDPNRFQRWLRMGGYETLASYSLLEERDASAAAAVFRARFGRHAEALQAAVPMVVDERFLYVHAGINPARPLAEQNRKDLYMIREGFLDYEGEMSHIVVHGHSITASGLPERSGSRIAIDTGAYHTGRLTCLVVSSDEQDLGFIFAVEDSGVITTSRQASGCFISHR